MKTKYILLVGFLSVIFLPLYATTYPITPSDQINVHSGYINNMNETWNVSTSSPTSQPLVINYIVYTESGYDFVTINNVDDNGTVVSQLLKLSGMQSGQITTQIPNGRIQVVFTTNESGCYANNSSYYNGITISFALSNNQVIDNKLQVTGDTYLLGKVGIGKTNPTQKLDVEGNVAISNKLAVGSSIYSYAKAYLYNTTDYYGLRIGTYFNASDHVYGLHSNATNSSGYVYGIYSTVSGQTGKKWAGYFTGGDVAVMSGNLGIGTITPRAALEVFGANKTPKIALRFTGTNQAATNYVQSDTDGHYLEFGTFGTTYSGSLFGLSLAGSNSLIMAPKTTGYGILGTTTATSLVVGTNNIERMRINAEGKVGIGISNITAETEALLTVNGIIHASEVRVTLEGLADYVFKPSYKLMPLHEVEQFVKTNSHLPEIPSAAEVQKNGLSVGEMQNKLLQKIEELTLYVIEQQKQIDELKRK